MIEQQKGSYDCLSQYSGEYNKGNSVAAEIIFFSDLQAGLVLVFVNTEISTFSTIISFVLFLFVQIVL